MQAFLYIFLLFILYSFIGWIIEVIHSLFVDHKFVNRGFLIGTYCPIYGCGALLMYFLLNQYRQLPLAVFAMGTLICLVLEYITSYLMEKIFKARWWDYSHEKFNLNGRICLGSGILFGLGGCIVIYFFHPLLISFLNLFPPLFIMILSVILLILFITDLIISFNVISNVKKEAIKFTSKDNTEEITRVVKEILSKKSIFNRRLVHAFPNLKNIKLPNVLMKRGNLKNEREI